MNRVLDLDKLIGHVINDDIELVELIGAGGMGVVYRGFQRTLGRDVCVKFMHSHLVAGFEWQVRFQREAKALAKLRHKNLAEVYSVGFHQNVYPYIVMELLNGEPLSKLIRENERLDWRTSASIMIAVCDVLFFVHEEGFVHRDLKPDNIFVCRQDDEVIPKVLDFGVVGSQDNSHDTKTITTTGALLGTLPYMAPECFRRPQRNPSIDVYALGCILFEMISGRAPFLAESPILIAQKHDTEDIPALDESVGTNQERTFLNAVIAKACRKTPEQRFRTCAEMADCLRSALDGNCCVSALAPPHKPTTASTLRLSILISFVIGVVVAAGWYYAVISSKQPDFLATPYSELVRTSRDNLRRGEYVLAEKHLTKALEGQSLSLPERIEATLMLVSVHLHSGDRKAISIQLFYVFDTLEISPGAELEKRKGEYLTRCLELTLEMLSARDGQQLTQSDFGELAVRVDRVLGKTDLPDVLLEKCVGVLAEMNAFKKPVERRGPTETSSSRPSVFDDLASKLIILARARPQSSDLYYSRVRQLLKRADEQSARGELHALNLCQMSIHLIEGPFGKNNVRDSKDIDLGLQFATRSVNEFEKSVSANTAGEYAVALILSAAYHQRRGEISLADKCAQKALLLLEQTKELTDETPNSQVCRVALALNFLGVDKHSAPMEISLARYCVPRLLQNKLSRNSNAVGLELFEGLTKNRVAEAAYPEAVDLAQLMAFSFRRNGRWLTAVQVQWSVAVEMFRSSSASAEKLAISAVNDLRNVKDPVAGPLMEKLVGFLTALKAGGNAPSPELDWLFTGLDCATESSAQWLQPLMQSLSDTNCGGLGAWVRQDCELVANKLLSNIGRYVDARKRPEQVYLVLAKLASLSAQHQSEKDILIHAYRMSEKHSPELLVGLAGLGDRDRGVDQKKVSDELEIALVKLSKTSLEKAVPLYISYAQLQPTRQLAVASFKSCLQLCRSNTSQEEVVLASLLWYLRDHCSEFKSLYDTDAAFRESLSRVLERVPPQRNDFTQHCHRLLLVAKLSRQCGNEELASQCLTQFARIVSRNEAVGMLYKGRWLNYEGNYLEAEELLRKSLLLFQKQDLDPYTIYYLADTINQLRFSLIHQGKYKEAIAELEGGIRLVTDFAKRTNAYEFGAKEVHRQCESYIAELEFLIGHKEKAEYWWQSATRKLSVDPARSRNRMYLYTLAGDKSRETQFWKSMNPALIDCLSTSTSASTSTSTSTLAFARVVSLWKLSCDLNELKQRKTTLANQRRYVADVLKSTGGKPLEVMLTRGYLDVIGGNPSAAEKCFAELDNSILDYDDWLLEFDIYGAKLFSAVRRNDSVAANKVLSRLRATEGRISPLLVTKLVLMLNYCEGQAKTNELKQAIHKVGGIITSVTNTI